MIRRNLATFERSMTSFSRASAERKLELIENYEKILEQVNSEGSNVRLVAISKLKPASDIMALYEHGVRHFGENYVQELIEKAKQLPKDIKWHFTGGLQSGKIKDLAKKIDSIYAIETVDSLKKCRKLESSREGSDKEPIRIFLQINTSDEEQKSGFKLSDQLELEETVEFIRSESCNSLTLEGLMTIGSFSESTSDKRLNTDFEKMQCLKSQIDEKYSMNLQLSMGMSNDFLQAIRQGSTQVRVGSSIFGARPFKQTS